jgi:hypothetical protein
MNYLTALRPWIQQALEMYEHISREMPSWKIPIEELHLQEWPGNGNFLDLVKTINNETVSDCPAGDNKDILGPAPLQNIDDPNETFVCTTLANREDNAKQCIDDATLALKDLANTIRVERDNAQMQQKDVLTIGSLTHKKEMSYAWTLTFPTLFPPTFPNKEWVILGGLTSPPSSGLCDQMDPPSEWIKWMLRDSNGQAAKHPLFALVLNSELTRTSLQSQV